MKFTCESQIEFFECMNERDSYLFLTNHVISVYLNL